MPLFISVLFATVMIAFCALVAARTGHPIIAAVISAAAWLFAGASLVLLMMLKAVG